MQENVAAPQMSSAPNKADVSVPGMAVKPPNKADVSAPGTPVKPADDDLLKASVPPPSDTPAQQPEHSVPSVQPSTSSPQSTPSESASPTMLPRPKVVEEVTSPETSRPTGPPATAPRPKTGEESLESKLAPAQVLGCQTFCTITFS